MLNNMSFAQTSMVFGNVCKSYKKFYNIIINKLNKTYVER